MMISTLTRPLGLMLWAIVLSMSMSMGWTQQVTTIQSTPTQQAATTYSTDTLVARTSKDELTLGEIQHYVRTAPYKVLAPYWQKDVRRLSPQELHQISHFIAACREATQEFDDLTTSTEFREQVLQEYPTLRDQQIVLTIMEQEVMEKPIEITQEMIDQYYEFNKPSFRKPFSAQIRQLILLTYEPYIVKEGDTLESIAKEISGKAARAEDIRADLPGQPLRREAGKEFKPLVPGETLLVPMGDEAAQKIKERLENILAQLDEGKSFEELAREYSEAGFKGEVIGPIPSGTRPLLHDVLSVIKDTPEGEISEPFRTKHGWQVIQVVERNEEHYITKEELKDQLPRMVEDVEREKLLNKLRVRIEEFDEVEIDLDLFGDPDQLTTETVVAMVGEYPVTWGSLVSSWKMTGQSTKPEDLERFFRQSRTVQVAILKSLFKEQLEDEESLISQKLDTLREIVVGYQYISQLAVKNTSGEFNVEELKKVYERNKERFKAPPLVRFASMEMHLGPAQMELDRDQKREALLELYDQMLVELSRVNAPEAFLQTAEKLNAALEEEGIEIEDAAEKMKPVDEFPETIQEALKTLPVNQWSQPLVLQNKVVSVLLLERDSDRYYSLEEVRPAVAEMAYKERIEETGKELFDEYAEKAGYEFVL